MNDGPPWRVVHVETLPGYRLHVRFVDGVAGLVELADLIFSDQAGVFTALRDPDSFARAGLLWGAVTWPGELDLAPDAMHDAIAQDGVWRPH